MIQLNGVDDEMKKCVSSLVQHYKTSSLVLKVDCAFYRLKNGIRKMKLVLICICVEIVEYTFNRIIFFFLNTFTVCINSH